MKYSIAGAVSLLLAILELPKVSSKCALVTLMGQHSCNKYDLQGMLEAISACAYPHYCHASRRQLSIIMSKKKNHQCDKLCATLGSKYERFCAGIGCSSDRRRLGLVEEAQEEDDAEKNNHTGLPLDTWQHLHRLGLRHVHPSMCNSSQLIETYAEETGQDFLKDCMDMDVAIFTNGTFHS